MRKFVHVGFAREMVGGGSQRAIRALTKWCIRSMKCNALIRHLIGCEHRRRSGVVIVVFPEQQRAVFFRAAAYVDYARGAEVCPGEFLFSAPHELYWFACGLCQARGFDCCLACMFASVCGTSVGNDDSYLVR